MLRLLLAAFALVSLLMVACGGGDDDSENENENGNGEEQEVNAGPTATPTPQLLPTPPAATDDEVILTASAGETVYTPTLQEFRDLPKVKIDAGGEKEGVSLAEIASLVSAPEESTVNIHGFRTDGRMIQFVREPLAEIGADSILLIDDKGRLQFYSSVLDESQWLINVTVVSFH